MLVMAGQAADEGTLVLMISIPLPRSAFSVALLMLMGISIPKSVL
jgi:hypothetical protein